MAVIYESGAGVFFSHLKLGFTKGFQTRNKIYKGISEEPSQADIAGLLP
jgi:hypothetical protein